MLDYTDILILVFAGCAGGFFSGFLGIGGGVVFIPFLDYFFKRFGLKDEELVRYILGNSLFIIIFTGLLSSYKQYRYGNFYPKPVISAALPGIFTALLFSFLIKLGNWYNARFFSIVFIMLLAYVALRMLLKKEGDHHRNENFESDPASIKKFSYIGAVTGMMSSLSGLGGGMIMVPAFMRFLHIDIKKATGISTGVVPFFALPMTLFYMFSTPDHKLNASMSMGYMLFAVTLPMIAGVVVMAPQGVKWARKVEASKIRIIFALVILTTTARMVVNLF